MVAQKVSPTDAMHATRLSKARAETEILKEAARIALRMGCPSLTNSLFRLADTRESEAKALTRVSVKEKK